MDAVKFLKEEKRMCDKYSDCTGCHKTKKNTKFNIGCGSLKEQFPEEFVAIVEKWSAEHPIKTRQSEFLKMFPDADIHRNGILEICPRRIENSKMFDCHIDCNDCRKEYWLAGVE